MVGGLVVLLVVIALADRAGRSPASPGAAPSGSSGSTGASAGSGGGTGASSPPVTTPYSGLAAASNSADGIPIGYPHPEAGAEAAAANYVVAYGSAAMVQPDARHKLVAAIADPAITSMLQSELDSTFTAADSSLGLSADGQPPTGLSFVARSVPVGVSVTSDSGDLATVAVWAVTFSGLAGTTSTHPVTENWTTITVTLHWTDGDWKWKSFTSADGPTPVGGQQTPSSSQALQQAVGQFGGLSYAR
jgi:hypothetical protein